MKLNGSILKEMVSKQLNTLLESSDDGDVYSHGIGGGRAVATKGQYPPDPSRPPPEEPKKDPLRFSFKGTALHQFFDSEYMMTPLIQIPYRESRKALSNIFSGYIDAVREGKSEGFINGFLKHIDDMGEYMKSHPDLEVSPQQIDGMTKKIKDKLIADRESGRIMKTKE